MAQQNSVDINVNVQGNAVESIGNVKKALKEANAELINAQANFGDYSKEAIEAAKKVAGLRDKISEAKETADLFDPGKKFQALAGAATAVAGGFTAVQGALGLLGIESESVEKTLLKVQSALALSQGLSTISDAAKDFKRFGTIASGAFDSIKKGAANAFKSIKAGLASTGIGLLVIALGSIVAYWDDIKELVGGVSSEQEKLNKLGQENLEAQEDKLDAIDGQSNVLRLQGKSEKDILNLKIAQTNEAIKAAEVGIANAKATKEAQVQASKRNREILTGIINFISTPVKYLLGAVDSIGKALGKDFGLVASQEKANQIMANYVFDPAETAKEGDKAIAEAEKVLKKFNEKKATSIIALRNLDKQGASDAEKIRKEKEAAEKEAQQILAEANKKLKTEQEQELLKVTEDYAEKKKKLELAGIKDNGDLAAAEQKERQAILDKYANEEKELKEKNDKEAKDKEAAFQKELNKITLETKLAGIVDENEKARIELLASYEQQRQDIEANENLTAEQKSALKIALATKENQALDALKLAEDKRLAEKELSDLDKKIADNETDLQIEKNLLDAKEKLLKDAYAKNLITEDEYKAALKANSKAKQEIDKQETASKIENAQKISSLLSGLSDLAGKETAAGKAFAVASATIDTYLGATKAYQSLSGIPVVGPALGAVAAGVAIAGGIKNVKSILAVKVPGGGGGGAANISAPSLSGAPIAPPQPQAQTTTLDNRSINAIGNQTTRAYVVESDVTNSQQRMAAIQQRARFG
jgi:hypothetical protein